MSFCVKDIWEMKRGVVRLIRFSLKFAIAVHPKPSCLSFIRAFPRKGGQYSLLHARKMAPCLRHTFFDDLQLENDT